MNVREEDRQKNNCPSRGLGLAAAAIGVGVGAALYYFFSQRPENPDGEGSTSGWACEQPHAFHDFQTNENSSHYTTSEDHQNEDSYMTISENTTSDTSIHETTEESEESEEESESGTDEDSEESDEESEEFEDSLEMTSSDTSFQNSRWPTFGVENGRSDSTDWDITSSAIGVPEGSSAVRSPMMTWLGRLESMISPRHVRTRTTEEEQMAILRNQALYEEEQLKMLREQSFRERTWSLEECSICFDIILKDQQVTTLPCTHHFHAACVAPWLQEQRTCPNCRKAA